MYNDELTAPQWALNSAVERHLHTSSRSNTFNRFSPRRSQSNPGPTRSNARLPQRAQKEAVPKPPAAVSSLAAQLRWLYQSGHKLSRVAQAPQDWTSRQRIGTLQPSRRRTRWRSFLHDSGSIRKRLTPATIYELKLENLITSNVFQQGYRIRLQISASFTRTFLATSRVENRR